MKQTGIGHRTRLAYKEEISLLRQRSGGVILYSLESLEEKKRYLANNKQNEYKAKVACYGHSGGRRKMWTLWSCRERSIFWAATGGKDCTGSSCRTSKETRKTILKAIIKEDGFEGELQEELEKNAVKKKRFKVFDLAKLSDLEIKFNSEALGSIAYCETVFINKKQQGLLPSATTFNNCLMHINREATRKLFSCMPETNTCVGETKKVIPYVSEI
jgi:hypothetical protein